MLTETGRVVAVDPDSLWVETIRRSTCGSCSAAKGCGHGILNRMTDGHRNLLKVSTAAFPEGRFQVDDEVSIAIPEDVIVGSSFVVYMVPLLCTLLVAGSVAGLLPAASDLATFLGAVLGFGLGVGLVRLHAWTRRDDKRLHPRLLGPAHGPAHG
ncbi:MAG: SoxR reducing system RseC family protein [Halieaceae bacterium]|jgi:sigma-E factor negative regulatory protein RseC|nr:SoxR reducing system RseC family protein [Halieaceae bacterium]